MYPFLFPFCKYLHGTFWGVELSMAASSELVFGVEAKRGGMQSLVVLDKSFLQAVRFAQLQYYVQNGWLFAVPDVFFYEHLRKWDQGRLANLRKLKSIENRVVLLPGIGEMFGAESGHLKPATQVLGVEKKRLVLTERLSSQGPFFELDSETKRISDGRTRELEARLDKIVGAWRGFNQLPLLKDAKDSEIPQRVRELSIFVRDDVDDIRGFYRNHRARGHPVAEAINVAWAFFRWTQVLLLGGLDFYESYGVATPFNRDKVFHELLDLDYLLPALLVGGLASNDKRMVRRFKFLRPEGLVLK
jgi:hypothetical protein